MHRVRMLIHFGVTPYLVFDGDYLPSKAATEHERAKRRAESKRLGLELHRLGKVSQAYLELQKAVDVTPEMARQLIEELKRHKIKYIVAPYEADAQLAYLEGKGVIHGVLSEDSDLLVFGVRRLLTKLDQYGECVEINRKDFTACKAISLVGWTDADFRRMAILSGCDYLPNINKMGLKTAYRLVRKHNTIEKILRMLAFDGAYRVPPSYLEDFQRAEMTFLHQRVYCPLQRQIVHATPLQGPEPENFDFVGRAVDATTAKGVADGDLHPMTKEQIIFYPSLRPAASPSPWGLKRSNTITTPSEVKPKKPIDDFFKPKRVPLAELDPNCFTPSPSQQRILEQQNNSVISTLVDATPSSILSRRNDSRPSIDRPPDSGANPSIGTLHPPKRPRLCAEDDSDGNSNLSPSAKQSRFFGSAIANPSPSLHSRVRRKRDANVNLWSDDSIDNAMAALPDVFDGREEAPSKLKIPCESGAATKPSTNSTQERKGVESEASTMSTLATEISATSNSQTPPSSFSEMDDGRCSQDQTTSWKPARKMTKAFELLSKRYSLPSIPPSPATSKAPVSLAATNIHRGKPIQRTLSRIPRSNMPLDTLTVSQVSDTQVRYPQLSLDPTEGTTLNPVTFVSDSKPVIPQSPESHGRQQQPSPRGSEDCLVPCSEAESEGEEDAKEEGSFSTPKLDLGRFAFASQRTC